MYRRVKQILKRSRLLVRGFRLADGGLRKLVYAISPELLAKINFRQQHGRWPDLARPQTFDEKLLWLMLFWQHPLKAQCADKYAVRAYVEKHGLAHLLPGLLGLYERAADIDFDALPAKFVLKCTHGCGMNIICRHKDGLDRTAARKQLDSWLNIDISKRYGELHYALIKSRILAECFIDDGTGSLPRDYKLYCFSGKVHCTMVCCERATGKPKFQFYDRDWRTVLPYSKSSSQTDVTIQRPVAYREMLAAAESLASPFPFVRVDFYSTSNGAVFGEMTFTPHACADPGYTEAAQRELGELIILPPKLLIYVPRLYDERPSVA